MEEGEEGRGKKMDDSFNHHIVEEKILIIINSCCYK
jgi:hypothetical protein